VIVQRLKAMAVSGIDWIRHRLGWADHAVKAAIRYDHADGGRLGALNFFGTRPGCAGCCSNGPFTAVMC
jgi:hypothetical protein